MLSGNCKSINSTTRIALIDCNNFYASCERVFRPDLQKRPIGVLSNNDGCIIARSNELKEAGIPMGAPYFKFKKELERINAVVVSSNYALYGDMSARVMDTIASFAPEIEVYSIDEAWVDLTEIPKKDLDAYCRMIAQTVLKNTGIPISIGIGQTKVLAKMANRLCKKQKIPGNVFNLGSADSLDTLLKSFDVEDIWGVGRRWSKKLNEQGIFNAYQLQQCNALDIRKKFSVVMQRIVYELQGHTCLTFEDIEPKKQIIASKSFGQRVTAKAQLAEALTMHVTRGAEKLRAQGSKCGGLGISIRTSPFAKEQYFSKSLTLSFETYTSDTRKMAQAASRMLDQIFVQGHKYAKAGIWIYDIVDKNLGLPDLFSEQDSQKSEDLMRTIDKINGRYGKGSIILASQGFEKKWKMQRNNMSPRYTTCWQELPQVQ